tara:strand:- start:89 stop:1186 length:1098 start_codon:yes stop_codon:yes gene_type:complete
MLLIDEVKTFCDRPFVHMKINHLGRACQCCYQSMSTGDILNAPIEEVWGSQLAKDIQKTTLKNELHPACKGWGGCPYIGLKLENMVGTHEVNPGCHYPQVLEVDLPPYHCNIGGENPNEKNPACIMCPRNDPKFVKNPHFHVNRFDEILEKVKPLIPHLKELWVLGVAEPFWKNAIFDSLQKLEYPEHRDKLTVVTFTNGTIFGAKTRERWIHTVKKACVHFSIDAATPETYRQIRRLDFYETIKRNITAYGRQNVADHEIRICHNINRLNFHELPKMVHEANEMGAHCLDFNPVHNAGGHTDLGILGLRNKDRTKFEESKRLAEEASRNSPVIIRFKRNFDQAVVQEGAPDVHLIQLVDSTALS